MPESINLTETELFSLYARYPEIRFQSSEEKLKEKEESSPRSNNTDRDEAHVSAGSTSTAHTTPPPTNASFWHESDASVRRFFENAQKSDLPESCRTGFTLIGKEITELGSLLSSHGQSESRGSRGLGAGRILRQSGPLLVQLRQCNSRIDEQIQNISFIKSLAPFTVVPSQQDLWCNYRQRAQLITKYTAPPSRAEYKMVEELTYLFDIHVYHSFLQLLAVKDVNSVLQDRINELYNALMSLLSQYRLWWNGMKDIKEGYMLPTLRAIRRAPEVWRQVKNMEENISVARAAIERSQASGTQIADEDVVEALNLTGCRSQWAIPPKSKRRYRREHTV